MGHAFVFEPVALPEPILTANREIRTPIPHPDDRDIVETLRRCEPRSMSGQPLVVWDRAEGVHVYDRHGNKWL
ncbi:MAG: aspartate aminotransferase family protein, partial [Verrucomicrobiae bacterium]|nr:aspartate aminotransferase family protein [Verrucomicrobiae bacterium]